MCIRDRYNLRAVDHLHPYFLFFTWLLFCFPVGQAADEAEHLADGAGEGLGHAESCFGSLCGWCDACEFCVVDEALAYALPFFGLVFSLFR